MLFCYPLLLGGTSLVISDEIDIHNLAKLREDDCDVSFSQALDQSADVDVSAIAIPFLASWVQIMLGVFLVKLWESSRISKLKTSRQAS